MPLILVTTLVATEIEWCMPLIWWCRPLIPALERNVRLEETALRYSLILRFLEAGSSFQTEVEVRASGWLFCFSDLQDEPQYLSPGFY